nr:PilZ domain-containing protein [Lachnospiraceae bacterium]
KPLASGLSPNDLPNLIQQRIRWARGVIATGRKMKLFRSKDMSFSQKMNYWASIWYWYAPVKRLIYIMSPILFATFNFMVFKCTLPEILIIWLPMYISSNISLRMLSENVRNTKWTGIYETILFPYMLIPVILESFGITLRKFKVTDKSEGSKRKALDFVYMLPFFLLIVLSVIGIVRSVIMMFQSNSFSSIVILFWLVNNLFLLVMSVFFVMGRVAQRKFERFPIIEKCTVKDADMDIEGTTVDLSEEGCAVALDKPYMLGDIVTLFIRTDKYSVRLKTEVIYVTRRKDRWVYSMIIKDYMDYYDTYLQILYDRVPMLPSEIKKDAGSFEDLLLNTKKRMDVPFYQKRKYPRINIGRSCNNSKNELNVIDFNYEYVSVTGDAAQKNIKLLIDSDLYLDCVYERDISKGHMLYQVINIREIVSDRDKYERLLDWLIKVSADYIEVEKERQNRARAEQKRAQREYFNEVELV